MARKQIRNDQWERIKDLLPGRSTSMHKRLFLEAVLWVARTGSPWRDLPPELGNWHATFTRFSRWRRQGVWQRVMDAISGDAELQALLPIRGTLARPRYGTLLTSHKKSASTADPHATL